MSGENVVATPEAVDADAAQLAKFGYGQELRRVLNLFENFAVAFCYISPVVGIYSLFVLGVGTGGPQYIWLLPIVVLGQLFVALVFAELGSHYPIAGALFQWGKNLIGPNYGWWVGWMYGWALIMTVASVDTGLIIYAGPLINNIFHTSINPADPNQILIGTVLLIIVQLAFNIGGVNFLGRISQIGVYFEIIGTFGIAIMLAIAGFHHGLDYLFTSQGAENAATSPLGVNFGGNWLLGAAFVAILAHVYIFYGFEFGGRRRRGGGAGVQARAASDHLVAPDSGSHELRAGRGTAARHPRGGEGTLATRWPAACPSSSARTFRARSSRTSRSSSCALHSSAADWPSWQPQPGSSTRTAAIARCPRAARCRGYRHGSAHP